MVFEKDYMPQFREADESGFVGVRGYLAYFQDVATHFMHNLGKGNDVLPEAYGICWMYTKYKLHIEKEADFSDVLHLETWIEKKKPSILINQALTISRKGEIYAQGHVESCLYDMRKKRLTRPEAVDFPAAAAIERTLERAVQFGKIAKTITDMEYSYTYKVRYTDLDKSRHMTNLRYISLLLDAFDSDFYRRNRVTDFEIHYLSQCFEGEEIKIYKKEETQGIRLIGTHLDGAIAVQGWVQVVQRITTL